jgi:hypothetical protein
MRRIQRSISASLVLLLFDDCLANATLHWNDALESKAGMNKCPVVAGLLSTAAVFWRAAANYCWTRL